jgi:hypothetical protein
VSEVTTNAAAVPLKLTAVEPLKFVPVIVTLAPASALVGVKLEIVGGLRTVKADELEAVPPGVITLIGPDVAPAGTVV